MQLEDFLAPAAAFIGSFAGLLLLRTFLIRLLQKLSQKHAVFAEVRKARALRLPSFFWCLSIAIVVGVSVAPLPPAVSRELNRFVQVLVILSVTLVTATLVSTLLKNALFRIESPLASSGLLDGVAHGGIFLIGLLVILEKLGVSISPMLTALGVGGIAVALALKDTLENLFSGINILIDRAVVLGDHIALETGQKGVVEDIGWRTSKIRIDATQMLIIPNVKLAQSILVKSTADRVK